MMLNLSTGHRPVRHPFETKDSFDLEAGTIFISDKEIRNTLSARVLTLPKLAIDQIKYYLKHLKKINTHITNINLGTGNKINKALASQAPLFFFLNNKEFIPVTPSSYEAYSSEILPLKLNWHRHFMRTWLRSENVHGHIVDGWMGHLGVGGDAFSRYSALGISDTRYISEKINTLLNETLYFSAEMPWREI